MDPVAAAAAATPDKIAIVDDDGSIVTYGEMNAEVNQLAHGLRALGMQADERAVWCGPNSRQVVYLPPRRPQDRHGRRPAAYRFTAEELQYLGDNSDCRPRRGRRRARRQVRRGRDRLPKVQEVRGVRRRRRSTAPGRGTTSPPASPTDEPEALANAGRRHHDLHVGHHREAQGRPPHPAGPRARRGRVPEAAAPGRQRGAHHPPARCTTRARWRGRRSPTPSAGRWC